MPEISCGNCGLTHDSVAAVRACHQQTPIATSPPEPSLFSAAEDGPVENAEVWTLDPGYTLEGETGPSGVLMPPHQTPPPSADLDPEQLAAVGHVGRSARIIAPAGSGKTRVLTERARHLISDWGVSPDEICLVAFNVRARAEMEERTPDLAGLQISTLNSLGLALLRGEPPFTRSRLVAGRPDTIDEPDVRDLLGLLVKLPRRLNRDPAAAWLDAFSSVRLGLRSPKVVEAGAGREINELEDVLGAYRTSLADRGMVDFDDQIYRALEILLRDPSVRPAARRACRVMLVDEFQDLTPAHLLLIRLVAGPEGTVFGVGDDDQTIYGYAGADPEWLVDFDRFFPGAANHALQTNYRCPVDVVDAARNLLTRNRHRVPKDILSAPDRTSTGLSVQEPVSPVAATTERILALAEQGVDAADIAVLTRVNATLAPVQVSLAVAGVPTRGGVGSSFLDRTGVRAALAWLRIALDPTRLAASDLAEAVRRPSRGLSPRLREWVAEQSDPAGLTRLAGRLREERDTERVLGLVVDIERLAGDGSERTTGEVLQAIRDEIGLGATVDSLDSTGRDQVMGAHGDDLAALIELAELQPEPAAFEEWLRSHLSRAWAEEGVELATIHRVKGMEWPHVVVHGVTSGLFPHRLSTDREEERRILHVGLTRSIDSTTVVASADSPSPFLAELSAPGEPPDAAEEHAPVASDADLELRERLREWRRDRARADGNPAFVVFNDRTLDDLVARRPDDRESLGRVHGIGPAKIETYGAEILAILQGKQPNS